MSVAVTHTLAAHFFCDPKGNRLEFRDFGVFNVKEQAARTGLNPKTMERVQVPAKRKVKFKMGRIMKQKLSNTEARV